jgi:hypothetical protein
MDFDGAASDSGIDTDMDSDYISISSTNYQFREESGRRCPLLPPRSVVTV